MHPYGVGEEQRQLQQPSVQNQPEVGKVLLSGEDILTIMSLI